MAVRTGAWKDKNPGRSARRADKKAAMKKSRGGLLHHESGELS